MKRLLLLSGFCISYMVVAMGQSDPSPAAPANTPGSPVSYASVSQLNGMLQQLESTSKTTQADLSKLRIEKWKADNSYKRQVLGNVDSIQRNLQGALPEIIAQLRSTPEDLPASFKLYRNLDALYDVLGNIAEGAGAFGPKDDLQSLSNDLSSFEGTRKQLADRIQNLSTAKEAEIARLRNDLKTAQASLEAATPPKKTVVDDTEPPKKPAATKKKSVKKSITPDKSAGQSSQPQSSQPQNPNKPQ